MVERLENPAEADLDALTALWEASVRATHGFLTEEEIGFYRMLVRKQALPAAELFVVRNPNGSFAAFAGLEADKIEMLFVAPDRQGQGLGSELLRHAVACCGARRVDVNEENPLAAAFYRRHGFRMYARDAKDSSGKAHPILHFIL